ncbi:hypothetical protein OQZ33_08220 [Pedobacter sp. MC2016-05]|uniref:hypothetical protein n=1 Tax=Pedobacter sp. MC2016-05 TaxID=2994474 RepID=UPI00224569E4|nr:hypothetical protein [Pedobacter sp. MC2016-05]MCX2474309.1 hypothetical protein [Pedobacter sp. MC2016-05]
MTAVEIKKEINKALDQVTEKLLVDILDLIKEVQLERTSNSTLTSNFKKILSEDSEVLHKLAQ